MIRFSSEEETEKMLKLYIDDQEISVAWEDNESVKALRELAEKGSVSQRETDADDYACEHYLPLY